MKLTSYLLAAALAVTHSNVKASTLSPPVLPLLVRNPYLSTWLANARGEPWDQWPVFWTGQEVGLSVLAFVPDKETVFPLLGRAQDSLNSNEGYLGATFDASTTNLTYSIPMFDIGKDDFQITLSFLSPITPSSTLRQAIPASYVRFYVTGTSGISIYIDMNGLWVSGDRGSEIVWEMTQILPTENTGNRPLKTWKVKRRSEQLFSENSDRAEWGTLYFSASSDVSYEAGTSGLLRQGFSKTGSLQNLVDDNFRSIMDKEPVFAFTKSFNLNNSSGPGMNTFESVTFTVAHIQNPVIQFASAKGLKLMKPLWASYYDTEEELIDFHYYDLEKVSEIAGNYSIQLKKDALASGSEDYKDILALSARQVIGACSFTGIPEDPVIFFKEISSDGNVNTVDVIYPSFPFFLYTNPRWLAWLMEPLIEHMLSGQYPNDYSMHDLGSSFPNATGHPDGRDEYMPVEECGNMLIMGLALINSLKYDTKPASLQSATSDTGFVESGDGKISLHIDSNGMDNTLGGPFVAKGDQQARQWIRRSYRLWKQWTGYLVREAIIPANQLSTDDFAGWLANQTNLALKGIIGIRAMAEISASIDEDDDAIYYLDVSTNYIQLWQDDFAISRDGTHVKLAYTWFGSWTTLYNLYADSLLCFHLTSASNNLPFTTKLKSTIGENKKTESRTAFVNEKIYRMQSDWYHHVRQRYGLPLDSRHLYAKSDWEFFAVAVSSRQVREEVVQAVALWVNETSTDLYDTEGTGGYPGFSFKARPVVGGHFAFLALERACGGKALNALSFLDEPVSQVPDKEEL